MVRELKHATSERLLQHIMATVGNGDVGADSVAAEGSIDEDDAEAKREALLNAPSEDGSDEEEAALKREAPVNCGHIVTWGVPISVEAVCCMRLKPWTAPTRPPTPSPPRHHPDLAQAIRKMMRVGLEGGATSVVMVPDGLEAQFYQRTIDESALIEYDVLKDGIPSMTTSTGAAHEEHTDPRLCYGEFESMDAARACQQAIEGRRLYGEHIKCEVIAPADDLFERVREAWGKQWVGGEQEALVGPVLMKVKMAAPLEWPRSKKMLVAVRTINSASGQYVICMAKPEAKEPGAQGGCAGMMNKGPATVTLAMCSHTRTGKRTTMHFKTKARVHSTAARACMHMYVYMYVYVWHAHSMCMCIARTSHLTSSSSPPKSGDPFSASEGYRQRMAHVVHLSGHDAFNGFSRDAFHELEMEEAFDIENEFKLAIKAIDLEGANLLHVLAAAHQEAPKRLSGQHVDDGGFVGMHLPAMPLSVICTIKPQLRAKFIDAQYNKQHARVEGMLRFAHDVKSQMDRHDADRVTAPRVVVRNLPMPIPLQLFKAVGVLGVSALKMRPEEDLDIAISNDSMGRLDGLDRAGCDVALLKLASPAAAAAALGQLRARNGETRLAVEGPASRVFGAGGRFSAGQPALPSKLEASSKDQRVQAMMVTSGGEAPADEEAVQLLGSGTTSECYLLGVHRLQLAMIHSSHSVRLRRGIKPLMPSQQARNEQAHTAKMEVHRRKLKQREKDEIMLHKRDEGGSRAGALKALTKRDLVFAFRTWRVSARRRSMHAVCARGVCAGCAWCLQWMCAAYARRVAQRAHGACTASARCALGVSTPPAHRRAKVARGGARRDGSGSRWVAGTSSSTPTRGASCPRRSARCGCRA